MYNIYKFISEIIKKRNMKDILYFQPLGVLNLYFGSSSLGDLLRCFQNDNFEGEFYNAFNSHHEDYELLSIAESANMLPRVIINNDKEQYKAIINVMELENEIEKLLKNEYFPHWKRQLKMNGIKPLYLLFVLETEAFIQLYKLKDYERYNSIGPDDYIKVGEIVMREYIRFGVPTDEILHAFNYITNQFFLRFKDMKEEDKLLYQSKITGRMKEVMIEEETA